MISVRDLHNLAHFRAEPGAVVSVYIELEAAASPDKSVGRLIADAVAKNPALHPLSNDLNRAAEFAAQLAPGMHRGAALFSAQRHGFWQACPLPEPAGSLVRLGDRPYLAPFWNLADQHRRYGIALVEGSRARFLESYLGSIAEIDEQAAPPSGSTGRIRGLMAPATRHLRAVAERLLLLSRQRGFERVILASPRELESPLIGHLHSFLQNNLIVDSQLNAAMTPGEVLEKVRIGESQSRAVRESVLVYRLLDAVRVGGLGVVGLAETLSALERGRVRMLLVRDGLAKIGRSCSGCGRLALAGKRCHACYQPTEPLFNLVSAMIQVALDLGCEVVRLLHDARLDNYGGIGAELSFPETPSATGEGPAALPAGRPARSPS